MKFFINSELKQNINKTTSFSYPSLKSWYKFLNNLFLIIGSVSILLSIVFFIAYNWKEINNLTKFILVESTLALSVIIYLYLNPQTLIAKITLFISSILVGILLALIGQVYQLQANSYELFLYWSIFIFPWVIISNFTPLWILWIILINITIYLFFNKFYISLGFFIQKNILLILSVVNTIMLLCFEYIKIKINKTLIINILALISGICITISMIDFNLQTILLWILWLGVIYYRFKIIKINLFILTIWSFSIIITTLNIFTKYVHISDLATNLLLYSLIFTILSGYFIQWLKSLQKKDINEQK